MKKLFENVFVTVGTTAFDDLIAEITSPVNLKLLSNFGCKKLLLQIGRGDEGCVNSSNLEKSSVHVEYYRFKPNLKNDLESADLVIGHAGAGTCLESLELKKPLLVVINEKLHDNHQLELAEKLSEENHLVYCTTKNLSRFLSDKTLFDHLRVFPPGNPKLFTDWLDKYLQFNH